MKLRSLNIVLLLAFVVGLTSCYENQEGCLDIQAKNYDVSADMPCDNCCKYPKLKLNVYQYNDTLSIGKNDTIINNLGQRIRLIDYVYFISNVVTTVDGKAVNVEDSIQVTDGIDTTWITNDFARIRQSSLTYTIGNVIRDGLISNVSFDLGLSSEIDGATIVSTTANALTTDPDSLRQEDNTYIVQRLQIATGKSLTDTSIIEIPANIGSTVINIPLDTASILGKDKVLDIQVEYQKWFDDVDVRRELNTNDVHKKMFDNLSRSFSKK